MAWVEVNLSAIRQNALAVKSHIDCRRLIAVVKADAYGHGLLPVAQILTNIADLLAVATVSEAAELRKNQIHSPILTLYSNRLTEVEEIVEYDLQPTVSDPQLCLALSHLATANNKTVQFHVNINTGMNRDGVRCEQAVAFIRWLRSLSGISMAGAFTHLATAEVCDSPQVDRQLDRFQAVLSELSDQQLRPPLVHVANSAAAMLYSKAYFDAVRVGLALYGIPPVPSRPTPIPLAPALVWKANVIAVQQIKAGESVSYGGDYTTTADQQLATVRVGYGDGFPRTLSNVGCILIAGEACAIVGRICMDVTVCRLKPNSSVQIGDEAVLIGQQQGVELSAHQFATQAGTIAYESLTRISKRVPRQSTGTETEE
ncbi:MAG: alanine racemase [Candidatus Poribacteria bacterium]|nr:alanine racemase [Candidatus Poribacteria bacterium]